MKYRFLAIFALFLFAGLGYVSILTSAESNRNDETTAAVETPTPPLNVALAANGGVASASSVYDSAAMPSLANDGVRNWATTKAWKDATPDTYPDSLEVQFNNTYVVNEARIYFVRDDYLNPVDPDETTVTTLYGVTAFDLQYWNGSAWVTVQNGSVTNNNKALVKMQFAAVSTNKMRVVVNNTQDGYSRIVEFEVYKGGTIATPTPTPTLSPTPTPRTNVAAAANGGIASASSTFPSIVNAPGVANNGIRNWAESGAWKDNTPDNFPDTLQIDFFGTYAISEVRLYFVRDDFTNPTDPDANTPATTYGVSSFDVQYWNGSAWVTFPGGSVTNYNKALFTLTFAPISTDKVRVVINNAQAGYSRVVEFEAWTEGAVSTPTPTPTATPTISPTPTPTPLPRINVAATANGGTGSASSVFPDSPASIAFDGIRNWATSRAWKDNTADAYPDSLEVQFNNTYTVNEVNLYFVRDDFLNTTDPDVNTVTTLYGVTSFDVQYWNGSAWVTVQNGSVTNNNKALVKLTFTPVSTNKMRVVINNAQGGYSRVVEFEVYQGNGVSSLTSEENGKTEIFNESDSPFMSMVSNTTDKFFSLIFG